MSGDELVYSPALDEIGRLDQRWPVRGDVHGRHLRAQERGEITYLVAQAGDGDLQGSVVVAWNGFDDVHARRAFPGCAEIRHLSVRDGHRGQGVATRLVEAAEEEIRARGVALAGLGAADDNDAARRLYRRLGYDPTGVVDVSTYTYVDDEGIAHEATERNEAMIKRLPAAAPPSDATSSAPV